MEAEFRRGATGIEREAKAQVWPHGGAFARVEAEGSLRGIIRSRHKELSMIALVGPCR